MAPRTRCFTICAGADDLYAMAGSIEHLIRIVTDMTNAAEDLEMKRKEKSLKNCRRTLCKITNRARQLKWQTITFGT